ncbi:hypothetical protein [Streptomyces triticiradicis]|uniref:Restriction endonuclease n=2 Tax=Streptomyces triticiradicis TaxID=2651189 RepID=A0A7J5D5P6_9ACTN|nr:hypothetical protein [Streptomyces triticiradicis]KAB1978581.1 hypothetical protein F8144_39210 [Streptomyces triticiradicis]
MAESVPVRCPACRREHLYAAPSYPCVCGSPVTAPLDRLAEPVPVAHRAWDDEWTVVRCGACGRETQWPHPELGCSCGTALRIPMRTPPSRETGPAAPEADTGEPGTGGRHEAREAEAGTARDGGRVPEDGKREAAADAFRGGDEREPRDGEADPARDSGPERDREASADTPPDGRAEGGTGSDRPGSGRSGRDGGDGRRPAFRPVTIRTARDAVTAAALYLGWLGYRDIRRADQRPPTGIGLAARGILAQVDPTVRPASLRDVECLWLTAMTESSDCVFFSLAGYAEDARARADTLGVPLFVLDLTGTPRPVNSPADELIAVTD